MVMAISQIPSYLQEDRGLEFECFTKFSGFKEGIAPAPGHELRNYDTLFTMKRAFFVKIQLIKRQSSVVLSLPGLLAVAAYLAPLFVEIQRIFNTMARIVILLSSIYGGKTGCLHTFDACLSSTHTP